MATIQGRMAAADILVIDGGMGTELERRGVEMDAQARTAPALRNHPDMIRAIHRDFIDAGADILIANTYAAAPHVLRNAGLSADHRPAADEAARSYARQAEVLVDASCDLLITEIMLDSTISPSLLLPPPVFPYGSASVYESPTVVPSGWASRPT